VQLLAHGLGQSPAVQTLAWLAQSRDPEALRLVEQLKEAMVQRGVHKTRDAHGNTVKAALAPAPIRHLEDPHARVVLAVWLCVAEACRNHLANSRGLWLGNIAARLGVCRWTVGRALDALQASGALKRWRPPADATGVVKGLKHGQPYNVYMIRVLPRELLRQVHLFYVAQKRRTSAPEMTEAPAAPTPTERAALERVGLKAPTPPRVQSAPSGPSVAPRAYAWQTPQQAAAERAAAQARFSAFGPPRPPGEA
jgi:hypothetical protein